MKALKIIIVIVIAAVCFWLGTRMGNNDKCKAYSIDSSTASSTVSTTAGDVCGYIENGIYTYKGIPYATAERFETAHPVEPWDGVRPSRYYGPTCPQAFRTGWLDDNAAFYTQWDDGYPGEDCLRINIWTPGINDGKARPVMFWIHGGGFASGSGQEHPGYDGHNMAAKGDVVFVSINHRLNSLGFLDLSAFGDEYKYSGNNGMLDIVAALQWVHDNIANFGGDPNNVTIMGQSGGGGKVSALYCMDKAKGLFHRAIVQSGAMVGSMKAEFSQAIGKRTVELLGLNASTIDKIKTVPYADLVKANEEATKQVKEEAIKSGAINVLDGMMFGWAPVVDGDVLTDVPFHNGTEKLNNDVPMMIGSTLNEFAGYMGGPEPETWEAAVEEAKKTYGDRAQGIIDEYKAAYPDAEPKDFFRLDVIFRPGVIEQADIKANDGGANVYTYMFNYVAPVIDSKYLAPHCAEIAFAFNNVMHSANMTGATEEGLRLGEQVSDAWLNFARNGDPNAKSLPQWDAYTVDDGAIMIFDAPECYVKHGNFDRKLMEAVTAK